MKQTQPSQRANFMIVLISLLVLSACLFSTAAEPERESIANNTQVDSNDGVELECEISGYPCSYADADPEILERSVEALDQAAAILDEFRKHGGRR